MDVTKHVIPYPLAMQLKKAGVKQDSLFYWCFPDDHTGAEPVLMNFSIYNFKHDSGFQAHLKDNECAAFMLSELKAVQMGDQIAAETRREAENLLQSYSA